MGVRNLVTARLTTLLGEKISVRSRMPIEGVCVSRTRVLTTQRSQNGVNTIYHITFESADCHAQYSRIN